MLQGLKVEEPTISRQTGGGGVRVQDQSGVSSALTDMYLLLSFS